MSPGPSAPTRYRWAAPGDLNAFFGLMLDNVMNLVILAGILILVYGFPEQLVYTRMFPGTALGVMFGDLVYTWLAFRLARKEGRSDVTAMPLGLDAPSTIGMAFTVLGPAFVAAKARLPEAEAAVPMELLEAINLVGPEGYVRERIAAFAEAGVSVLNITPIDADPVGLVERLKGWVA